LQVQVDESTQWPDIQLTPDQRRNLFLVVKECLHNVVKHACATEVRLQFAWKEGELNMILCDDGIGFDPAKNARAGNGLRNMQERMSALNGRLCMEHDGGTRILCSVPLANKSSIAEPANRLHLRAHGRS
jgi:signal transduction histidine kinase